MLILPPQHLMNTRQQRRWAAVVRAAHLAEARGVEDGDPWVFHSTTQAGAMATARGGFRMSWVATFGLREPCAPCVYWAKAAYAAQRALFYVGEEAGLPVLVAARLSSVLAAGAPFPDLCMWDEKTGAGEDGLPMPTTWQETYDRFGSIASIGGAHVEGLRFLRIQPDNQRPVQDPDVFDAWARGQPVPEPWGGRERVRLVDDESPRRVSLAR